MRNILFRGKRVDNGEWVYGSFDKCYGKNEEVIHYYIAGLRQNEEWEIIPETVGQYTGLTDKNGKKIFEGDIVSEKPPMNKYNFLGKVFWDEKRGAWRFLIFEHPDYVAYLCTYGVEYTVIGNIHDNPELLEDEK